MRRKLSVAHGDALISQDNLLQLFISTCSVGSSQPRGVGLPDIGFECGGVIGGMADALPWVQEA